jgi:four helix bundle protein
VREQEHICFSHERLDLYWEVIGFIGWLSAVLEPIARAGDVRDQLDRASNSIALNLAEGNGKFTARDRCRYFDSAHGSALECAAGLDVLVARKKLSQEEIRPGKERLQRIVQMLIGLIKRNSTRDYEKSADLMNSTDSTPS